jgi:hypothetical protein
VDKCKIIHFGSESEMHRQYAISDLVSGNRVYLEVSQCEKDLSVHITLDLRWKTHIETIFGKNFMFRPHLEFASTVWSPHLFGDIDMLEKVQERAARIPFELRGLS